LEQELGWDPRDPRIGWPKNPGTIWVNYPNIALKNPYFRSVNYYNLPRPMYTYVHPLPMVQAVLWNLEVTARLGRASQMRF
jgi:hypothetical protein